MTKGMYSYIREAWAKPNTEILRQRMTAWRKDDAITELEKPLRLDRARALGYKAKKGFFVVRVRLLRGGRRKTRPKKGRRSKRMTVRKTLKMSYQWVAEQRAERKYTNLVVLNSYFVGKDGMHYFYEIILVDPNRPEIQNDTTINWICKPENDKRALRGLTSAARKSRGLRKKSHEMKVRPSSRAHNRKGK